ncbi:hypothetical protein ACH5RR_023974 [Cinchona calisaya]|uniref:Major pollen allergen Ole e 6-like n=1 Tax=Cinchona calisaya TaxID=153742 RepID=A0ABD2ZFA2_9GENT
MAKIVAVFLMCMVAIAAVHIHKAEATTEQQFSECYHTCHKECFQDGKANGYTFCEMKCDADCASKELKAKLLGQ